MADTKISELPAASPVGASDVVAVVQGGATKGADMGALAGLASGSVVLHQRWTLSGTSPSISISAVALPGNTAAIPTTTNSPDSGVVRVVVAPSGTPDYSGAAPGGGSAPVAAVGEVWSWTAEGASAGRVIVTTYDGAMGMADPADPFTFDILMVLLAA